jgi:hypothetical protein
MSLIVLPPMAKGKSKSGAETGELCASFPDFPGLKFNVGRRSHDTQRNIVAPDAVKLNRLQAIGLHMLTKQVPQIIGFLAEIVDVHASPVVEPAWAKPVQVFVEVRNQANEVVARTKHRYISLIRIHYTTGERGLQAKSCHGLSQVFFLNLLDVLALPAPAETRTGASITPLVGSHRVVCAFTTHDSPRAHGGVRGAYRAFRLIDHILVQILKLRIVGHTDPSRPGNRIATTGQISQSRRNSHNHSMPPLRWS